MKPLKHHIDTVRAKPPHIRKQVAFASAFGATALIAIVWLGVTVASGAYAIQGTSFAQATSPANIQTPPSQNASGGLLSAVSAAFGASSTPAHINVVNANSGTTQTPSQGAAAPTDPGGPTVIPF